MKNQTLSIEQMKHLKDLGVDTNKASMVCLFLDDDGNEVEWDLIERHGREQDHYYFDDEYEHDSGEFGGWIPIAPRFYDAKTGYYDHSRREGRGVFTLQDMLEMMPKEITVNGLGYNLCFNAVFVAYINVYFGEIRYTTFETTHYGDFLKGAYQMLCWLTGNGHLKGGKP